jgi:outer membrane protein assembly factor BamB
MKKISILILIIFLTAGVHDSFSQGQQVSQKPMAPATLPGKGLAHFDFFYAGEGKVQNMYMVRKGKVVWSYQDTVSRGEISDAVVMTNGNILFAHQYGITLITPEKKVLWKYTTPKGHETHTAQPIGKEHVVFIQNGDTARLFVVNIRTGKTVTNFILPTKKPIDVHSQFRRARLTDKGTMMVAHMDLGKVCEYDINGKEQLSLDVPSVWSAEPLKNGNILVASNHGFVRELNRKGEVVWEYLPREVPDYTLTSPQIAFRRPNGNTIINNWFSQFSGKLDRSNPPIQAVEVTNDKRIVWALRAWDKPDLGPSTVIQIMDEPGITENVFFGHIR